MTGGARPAGSREKPGAGVVFRGPSAPKGSTPWDAVSLDCRKQPYCDEESVSRQRLAGIYPKVATTAWGGLATARLQVRKCRVWTFGSRPSLADCGMEVSR